MLLGGNWGLSCHFSPFAHTEQRSAVLLINFVFLMFWKPSAGRSKLDLVSFLGQWGLAASHTSLWGCFMWLLFSWRCCRSLGALLQHLDTKKHSRAVFWAEVGLRARRKEFFPGSTTDLLPETSATWHRCLGGTRSGCWQSGSVLLLLCVPAAWGPSPGVPSVPQSGAKILNLHPQPWGKYSGGFHLWKMLWVLWMKELLFTYQQHNPPPSSRLWASSWGKRHCN